MTNVHLLSRALLFHLSLFLTGMPTPANCGESANFTPLFNGADLSGWVNVNCAPETWQTSGTVVYCSGVPTGVLRSPRMYQNFILELEWRHLKPKGNAGVFVWAGPEPVRGQPFVKGVEVQVLDGQEGSWFTSDGDIFPIHGAKLTPENGRGGDRAFPTEKRAHPSPKWNHYRIECADGKIALAVNGKIVTRGKDASPRKGFICLESEGSPVEFRNVRLQELPAATALPPDKIAEANHGYTPMYNGLDLRGWTSNAVTASHWKAADWILENDGRKADGVPDLWSEKEYGDYDLIVDWRLATKPVDAKLPVILPTGEFARNDDGSTRTENQPDAGEGGIFLRGDLKSEVGISCWPIGSGDIVGYREDASLSATVRTAATPRKKADRPIGEWNRFEITLRGTQATVKLNGELVVEKAKLPGIPSRGRIGLEHGSSPIQFANLRIRELD